MKVNHKELKEQLRIAYETKTPLFIWGTTGIGKSDSVRQIAKQIAKKEGLEYSETNSENGFFGFVDIRISQLEPSDLRGLPTIDKDRTKWLIPNWLPKNPDSKGILFFDEINLSPPSIQATAYQLILDRKLGDYRLPKGWVIVSAGNRVEDKCNVFEMSSALCNRFIHTELSIPDKDSWTNWALENEIDNRIIAFIQFKPSSLFNFDGKNKDKAFPTPRSWAFCSRLIKDRNENKDIINILVGSAVGEATAT
jgi:MoxR-like ATPase